METIISYLLSSFYQLKITFLFVAMLKSVVLVVCIICIISADICPDKKTVCKVHQTCCPKKVGYGCCPFEDGVCCQDKTHCCPEGFHCDIKYQVCRLNQEWMVLDGYAPVHSKNGGVKRILKEKAADEDDYPVASAKSETGMGNAGKCRDGKGCARGYVCCALREKGSYGCCPYKGGVCCRDKIHCCPHGTSCNSSWSVCDMVVSLQSSVPAYPMKADASSTKWKPFKKSANFARSCGTGTRCGVGSTCCPSGCCLMSEGICCEASDYCCPKGYGCTAFNKCISKGAVIMYNAVKLAPHNVVGKYKKFQVAENHNRQQNVTLVCPDHHQCPDGDTCCKMQSGAYGCCPLPQATCCADGIHCCPHGYWCTDDECERLPVLEYGDALFLPKLKSLRVP